MESLNSLKRHTPTWVIAVSDKDKEGNGCQNYTSIAEESHSEKLYLSFIIILSFFNILINSCGLVFCHKHLVSQSRLTGAIISSAQSSHKSTLGLLIRLASVEIAFNFCVFWHFLLDIILEHKTFTSIHAAASITLLQNLSISFMVGFQCTRNWTIVFIALMRMLAVWSPYSWFPKLNKLIQSWFYLVFLILVLLFTAPRSFEFVHVFCVDTKQIVAQIASSLLENQKYSLMYLTVALFVIQSGGPIILVVLFSAMLSHVIMQRRKRRQHFGNASGQREKTTAHVNKTVITLSIIFFIFEFPTFLSKLDVALGLIDPEHPASLYIMYLGNIMTCLDSTMNVIIYILANPKFKKLLVQKLGKCDSTKNISPSRNEVIHVTSHRDGNSIDIDENSADKFNLDDGGQELKPLVTHLFKLEEQSESSSVQNFDCSSSCV